MDCNEYVQAMKEINGKYVGNRPIKLLPSKWTNKSINPEPIKSANQATQITEFSNSSLSLVDKYAHLIKPEDKERI